MDPMKEFYDQKRMNVEALGSDQAIRRLSDEWFSEVSKRRYSYHFTWLGVPIIQSNHLGCDEYYGGWVYLPWAFDYLGTWDR